MRKIWLMAVITYKNRVRSGTFLIMTFALPLLMVIAGAVAVFTVRSGSTLPVVGVVDQTGQLVIVPEIPLEEQQLELRYFENSGDAQNAYKQGEIGAYLIIPSGYFEGEQARFYAVEKPGALLTEGLEKFMRHAMLPQAKEWQLERLENPINQTYVALRNGESVEEGPELILRIALPIGIAIFLAFALLFTTSQMGAAVVREKDQRALEMIITSLKPDQLVTGKVLGMTLLSLTQIAIWGLGAVIAVVLLLVGNVDFMRVSVPWVTLMWAILLGVPCYFLYAIVAAGIGIIAGDTQQAQQLAGFLGFIGMSPLWLSGVFVSAPESIPAVMLTLFPLTAPVVTLLRMAISQVPVWQLFASLVILLLSLAAGIWGVSRIFRTAMLMYGQALSPRKLLRAFRQN